MSGQPARLRSSERARADHIPAEFPQTGFQNLFGHLWVRALRALSEFSAAQIVGNPEKVAALENPSVTTYITFPLSFGNTGRNFKNLEENVGGASYGEGTIGNAKESLSGSPIFGAKIPSLCFFPLPESGVAFEPNFAARIARRRTQNKEDLLGVRPLVAVSCA